MASAQHAPAYPGAASYADAVTALEEGLQAIERTFASLNDDDWSRPTLLKPLDADLPPWDVFTLLGHFQISIGLTLYLLANQADGQPGRDQVSFFIFNREQVAPVVYQYAIDTVKDQTPQSMLQMVRETFLKTIEAARTQPPETVGSGYYALMRLDEFVTSRCVEAVVHGMDLTDALGRPPLEMPRTTAITASILDQLLARRTVAGRPDDLKSDDLAFIRAASGRGAHPDPRFPLIG